MPVDIENLKLKLQQFEEYIEDVKKLRAKPQNEFTPRSDTQTLAERHIEKACQAALDIANHIIAEEGLGQPTMYKELGYILAKEGVITEEMAKKMEDIAKFRNRLVHEYAHLDSSILYEIIHLHIDDLVEFAKQIYSYIDKSKIRRVE